MRTTAMTMKSPLVSDHSTMDSAWGNRPGPSITESETTQLHRLIALPTLDTFRTSAA